MPMTYSLHRVDLPLRMHVHCEMAGAVEDVGMVRILAACPCRKLMEKERIQFESGQIWTRILRDHGICSRMMEGTLHHLNCWPLY